MEKKYQYIADAVKEEAQVRLKMEPELRNLLRAIYCIKCEVDLLIGDEMERQAVLLRTLKKNG